MQPLWHRQRRQLSQSQQAFWLTCIMYCNWKRFGGTQWTQYDKAFREWAAAKELRVWGKLNLPIFCHCLATQQKLIPQPQEFSRPSNSPYSRGSRGCRMWNFEDACTRRGCHFRHNCYYCEGPHKAPNCPLKAEKGQSYPVPHKWSSLVVSSVPLINCWHHRLWTLYNVFVWYSDMIKWYNHSVSY